MYKDPIVEEVRRIKEEHAAKYGFDVRRMGKALMLQQERGRAAAKKKRVQKAR